MHSEGLSVCLSDVCTHKAVPYRIVSRLPCSVKDAPSAFIHVKKLLALSLCVDCYDFMDCDLEF